MKYDELLEKAKELSDRTKPEDNKISYAIGKDIYKMLLRFKKERKMSAVDSKLRVYLADAIDTSEFKVHRWSEMKSCYFLLRYVYLETFYKDEDSV